jgi:hypothetical protein
MPNAAKRFVLGDRGRKAADALHSFCVFVFYRHPPPLVR